MPQKVPKLNFGPSSGDLQPVASHAPTTETTYLTPPENINFNNWINQNKIKDLDDPESHYDYRGYWKDIASKGQNATEINPVDHLLHYTDTYKQHGHPTFSSESQYSRGLQDGGRWIDNSLVAPPTPSHAPTPELMWNWLKRQK